MIYLDNAATSHPKAPGISEAMGAFLAETDANPGRAGHRMAVAAEQMMDDLRLALCRMFDAGEPARMIFALNCTDALNMAIKGVLLADKPDGAPHVVTTVVEHNSVSRPLQSLADRGRIELTRVDCDDLGWVDPDDIKRAVTPATRMIVMTHASNVVGTIQDAATVGQIAREHEVLFCLDAAQTVGVLPISIEQMQIDLLAFPGHKSLLGPTGTGGLYVGQRCGDPGAPAPPGDAANRLAAWREGGTGGDSSSPTQPPLLPYYLEGGTPNTVGLAGLAAAITYLKSRDMPATLEHERRLCQAVIDRFADDPRITLYGPRDTSQRAGALSINIAGYEPADVGAILDDSFDIAVRPGLHCAPYLHRRLGTFAEGTVRISPGPFSTVEDMGALMEAIEEIAG